MRTKQRVEELEYDMAHLSGEVASLRHLLVELHRYLGVAKAMPEIKMVRKYVKSGKYSKKAKAMKKARSWTDAQRQQQSDRLKAAWAAKKGIA